ncbi:MAG: DALR domain-containing protein, partial [Alistipes ihumii]|nr:DALR domain-containing protein [Alistipes ihumii]
AAEKGYERLMKAVATLPKLKPSAVSTVDVSDVERRCVAAMDDDLNTPVVISVLFDCVRTINQIYDGHRTISEADLKELARVVRLFVFDILGLRDDLAGDNSQMLASVVDMVLDIRQQAKAAKDWATSDRIRDGLASVGIRVKDRKDGYDWETE